MARFTTILAGITLLFTSTLAAPAPTSNNNVDILKRVNAAIRAAQPTTQPPQSSLGAPDGTLQYVVLGLGTQNYTCKTSDSSSAPASNGAKATLYDVTSGVVAASAAKNNAVIQQGTCRADKDNSLAGQLSVIGVHYFDAGLVPTFDLNTKGLLLRGGNKVIATSPVNTNPCNDSTALPAVPWIKLSDVGGSTGLTSVYRVMTAGGGAPPTCDGQTTDPQGFTLPYAALYYLYGPGPAPAA